MLATKVLLLLNNEDFKEVFHLSDISSNSNLTQPDLVFEFDLPRNQSRKTDSTCSSRSSNTTFPMLR